MTNRRNAIADLLERFEAVVHKENVERESVRMLSGTFDMNDFREQLCVLHEIGPLHAEVERADIVCISAIVASMTDDERRHPERFLEDPGRVARAARAARRTRSPTCSTASPRCAG